MMVFKKCQSFENTGTYHPFPFGRGGQANNQKRGSAHARRRKKKAGGGRKGVRYKIFETEQENKMTYDTGCQKKKRLLKEDEEICHDIS